MIDKIIFVTVGIWSIFTFMWILAEAGPITATVIVLSFITIVALYMVFKDIEKDYHKRIGDLEERLDALYLHLAENEDVTKEN